MLPVKSDTGPNRIVLLHGSCGASSLSGWFPYIIERCKSVAINIEAHDFPDPLRGRAKYWMPFLINEIRPDGNTVLVGHSSGGLAALRYTENFPIYSSILVAVHHSDCGFEIERRSGFFDTPFNWRAIKKNQCKIIQFHSRDDPWVPVEEGRYIHKMLSSHYIELCDEGHFGSTEKPKYQFPELFEEISKLWSDVLI